MSRKFNIVSPTKSVPPSGRRNVLCAAQILALARTFKALRPRKVVAAPQHFDFKVCSNVSGLRRLAAGAIGTNRRIAAAEVARRSAMRGKADYRVGSVAVRLTAGDIAEFPSIDRERP